jgi:Protein of unknown function (DUF2840)
VPALTQVREEFVEGRYNYRLLFGHSQSSRVLLVNEGHSAKLHAFTAGARFALDLWSRNAYGTVRWRCFVCETVSPREQAERVPFVSPAARVLLSTEGAAQSRVFLAWLRGLEAEGTNLLECPAELFLAAHFRLHGSRADTLQLKRLSGRL